MHEKSDAQLLREYAERGTEIAFREIVERHADVIYSSALRQMTSPDLARDVAQSVFIDLARKAPSVSETIDWAHTLLLIGAKQIDAAVLRETLPVVLKHRTDLELVAERAGVVLGEPATRAGGR